MSSVLLDQLLSDIKVSMKARESEKLTALRTLNAEIKNYEIRENKPIDDGVVVTVVQKAIKQREDAAEQYAKANREDLAVKERAEIGWYKVYLPQQMDRAEIEAVVADAIAQSQASSAKDMGKVMKFVMPAVKGKADGRLVNQVVGEMLGKLGQG